MTSISHIFTENWSRHDNSLSFDSALKKRFGKHVYESQFEEIEIGVIDLV